MNEQFRIAQKLGLMFRPDSCLLYTSDAADE